MTKTVLLGDEYKVETGKYISANERSEGDFDVIGANGKIGSTLKPLVDKSAIVLGRVGSIGNPSFISNAFWPSDNVIYITPKDNGPDIEYLYYKLLGIDFMALNVGSTQPLIKQSDIKNLSLTIPSDEDQHNVVNFLKGIDKKVELNRRMNETLEKIGQTLFNHYFLGNKKEEECLTIGNVSAVIDCLHSKKPEQIYQDTANILLQLNNITDEGVLDLTNRFHISNEDYVKWISRIEVRENDFVITNVGRSGAVAKIPHGVKAAIGRNMTAIRLKKDFDYPGFFSFLLNSDFMKKQIDSMLDHGTILSALNVKNIPKLRLPTNDEDQIKDVEKEFIALRQKIEQNYFEIQTLNNLRDSLLPRLISGKLAT